MQMKKKNTWKNVFVAIFLPVLILLLFVLPIYAATETVSVLNEKISITGTISGGGLASMLTSGTTSVSGDTVTATAVGGRSGRETNTISICNNTGKAAKITFDYTASNYNSFSESNASGSKSVDLAPGETKTIFAIEGKKATTNNTATLTISNFTYEAAADESEVTFNYTGGSVTVGGAAIANGGKASISSTDGAALVATPSSGYSFLGWVNGNTHELLSTSASYTLVPVQEMTVIAAFTSATSPAWFSVDNRYYNDLNDAATYAATTVAKRVILSANGTLPAGNYSIPSGVTLLIPFDDANTLYTTTPGKTDASYSKPTAYRTLVMASGAVINVNGAMSLSAYQKAGGTLAGAPTGPVSFVRMENGSSIVINNGGSLYAWGYITGSGSVIANSGAKVYEDLQVANWRGGSATSGMLGNDQQVFPMSQYYLQNIEVPLTLHAGAEEYAYLSVSISYLGIKGSSAKIIGDGGMFDVDSGYLVKDYIEATDRLEITVGGDDPKTSAAVINMNKISVTISGAGTIDSSDYMLPLNNNITVIIKDGSVFNVTKAVAMLPGSEVVVESGATCVIGSGSKIVVYDKDNWGNYALQSGGIATLGYAPGRTLTKARSIDSDAKIHIAGTLLAVDGALYCTEAGAMITGEEGGKIKCGIGTDTVTYQATQSGTTISYVAIPVTPAKLQHGDGTYLETAKGGNNTYTYTNGRWVCTIHDYETTTNQPTCSAEGSKVSTCSRCGHTITSTIAKVDHESGENTGVVTPPTCTEKGYTTFTCIYCQETYIKDEVAELGHDMKQTAAKVEPKCGVAGKEAVYACANGCGHATGGEEIAALEHDMQLTSAKVDAQCGVAGKEAVYTCANGCGHTTGGEAITALEHDMQQTAAKVEPKCGVAGKEAVYTCANGCGHTTGGEAITALEHDMQQTSAKVDAQCGVAGKEAVYTCANGCGHTTGGGEIAALEHDYNTSEYVEYDDKQHGYACIKCGAINQESLVDHTYAGTECTACKHGCEHSSVQGVNSKTATCTEDGWIQHYECTNCGKLFADLERNELPENWIIPALGHVWGEVTYTWNGDYTSCTATMTCERGCSDYETVTVSSVPTSPTCGDDGYTVYTAVFTKEWVTDKTQTKTVVDENSATGEHSYTYEQVGTAQHKQVCSGCGEETAPSTCSDVGNDENHVCDFCGRTNVTSCQADETQWGGDTEYHWRNCLECGECCTEKVAHTLEWRHGATSHWKQCTGCVHFETDHEECQYTQKVEDDKYLVSSATCTANATYYYSCSCGAKGTQTFESENESGKALGHDWGEVVYKWNDDYTSCTATRTCQREGCGGESDPATETANATVTSEQTKETCTENGTMTYTATFTEEWAKVQTKEVAIEKLGHDYKSVVTAPNCTAGGYTTYTCQREGCEDSYVDDWTEARGHQYAEVVTDPTCTKAGYTTYTCQYTDCNHSYTVDGDDAKGHTAVTDAAVAPTCTEKGKTEGSHCSVCEEVLTAQTDVDALGHKNGDVVVENDVKPTCTEAGHYDNVIYCTVCTQEVSRVTITVDALGHTDGEAVKENNVKPTCTKDGSYESVTKCSVCGAEAKRETVTVEKLGHTEVVDAAVAATCKATGLTEGKHCSVCNEVLVAQTETAIDSDNHEGTLVWVSVDADYHSQKYSCCGTVTEENEKHVWNGDTICDKCNFGCDHEYTPKVTAPTCTDKGYTTYTCSHCGHNYQGDETAALGHTEVIDEAVEATCTATGLTEGKHCSVCKEVLTAQTEVPAKGHTEVIDKAVAPTCTATGLTEGKHCSVCSEVLTAQTVVAAKGHTEVIDAAVSATCTETGLTEGKHCSVCSEVLTAQTVVAAKGHTEVVDEAVAATCTETGLTEGKHCSVCSEVLVAQTPIDAKGHTEETIAGKAETCTETGLTEGKKCTACGVATVTQQIIPAKGHDYNYVVTTEATCSTPGEETGTCTRCSDKTTKVIPATNKHDYSVIVCDMEYKWKKCSACEATNEKAPRTFRIVFQGGAGGDDIVLPGVYFYGYNETFIVPEFVSNFFKYEYSWAVDGQKLEPGKTMHVSDLASLIKTDPTVDNWNTIYVEGGYQVSGLDPNAIQMSMQYQNNSDVQNNEIFLTLSIFIRVEPGMTHNVVQSGGTEHTTLNIDGEQVGNLGLYHYQIPLTAEQMNDKSLTIEISYTENGRPVLTKVIGVNLMAYSDALNAMLGPDVTGQASQQLIAATMAYGAAIQTMDKKDAEGNVIEAGSVAALNDFDSFWRNVAKQVGVTDSDIKNPIYSQNATTFVNSTGESVEIAKFTGANVAMSKTYALLYSYAITLPEGAKLKDLCLILTDEDNVLDRDKEWDGKIGTSYTETSKISVTQDDGTQKEYDVLWVKDVPASEMAIRYATIYVKYTIEENGQTVERHAYSRTMQYGVITYLNSQIAEMTKTGVPTEDADLKMLYLWGQLRTVATFAENSKD